MDDNVQRIADVCIEQGLHGAVAESLTSGALASRLGAGPEAADWFRGGLVAYDERVKFDLLGVTPGPLVTERCAREMAEGVARLLGADAAIGVTGVGGPEPSEGEPPGTVIVAVRYRDAEHIRVFHFKGSPGPPWPRHPELRSFVPPDGSPYVHLQQVNGSPRVHCDLETEDPGATVENTLGLGATLVGEQDRWQTLLSPGGLPFCVLQAEDHQPPEPVTWPGGHHTRPVQVCIDTPLAAHDREVAFWRGLLRARWVDSPAPEFAGKWHDDTGSPLQLLFQELDEPEGSVGAHLDLGTDDVTAEVLRLRGAGAAEIGPGRDGPSGSRRARGRGVRRSGGGRLTSLGRRDAPILSGPLVAPGDPARSRSTEQQNDHGRDHQSDPSTRLPARLRLVLELVGAGRRSH